MSPVPVDLFTDEHPFALLANTAPVLMWVSDPSKGCIWFNKPWLEFTGRTLEQERGAGWSDGVHEEDRERCLKFYADAFETRQQFSMDYRLRRKDGEYRWILHNGAPLYERGNDEFAGFVGSCVDISEQKFLVSETVRLLEAERTLTKALQRATLQHDDFLRAISHELRDPLHAILTWAKVLKRQAGSAEALERGVSAIETHALAQAQVIADLFDISRLNQGKLMLSIQPILVQEVIDAAIAVARPAAEIKGVRICTQGDNHLTLSADRDRLQQVLWNLLNNAVKFTASGGEVLITTEADGQLARITVRDSGIGISPDFLLFVFERFRQADMTRTRTHRGLGLGLALVKQLTEMQGGMVEAESAGEHQGSRFTVILPLSLSQPSSGTKQ